MSHQIVDNYLPKEDFTELKDLITGINFPWFYTNSVANINNENEKNAYFSHMIFNMTAQSSFFDFFYEKLIKHISPMGLRRVKVNLYPKSEKLIYHPKHVDFSFPHKGFILYLSNRFSHLSICSQFIHSVMSSIRISKPVYLDVIFFIELNIFVYSLNDCEENSY